MISKSKNLSQAVRLPGHTLPCPAPQHHIQFITAQQETEPWRGSETWLRPPLQHPHYISVVTPRAVVSSVQVP